MRFSEDRISHLAHLIIDTFYKDDLVDYPNDDDQDALRATKRILNEYFSAEAAAEEVARKKIASQSKAVPEGSRDWDILFRKYLEEELKRRLA